jgi:DnaJ homolog subfamily C member 19
MFWIFLALAGCLLLFFGAKWFYASQPAHIMKTMRIAATLIVTVLAFLATLRFQPGVLLFGLLAPIWMARHPSEKQTSGQMGKADAAALLGVAIDANDDMIEEAFRRLMMKNHPDQGGSADIAQKLNEARRILRQG